jgi:hypothetical protein
MPKDKKERSPEEGAGAASTPAIASAPELPAELARQLKEPAAKSVKSAAAKKETTEKSKPIATSKKSEPSEDEAALLKNPETDKAVDEIVAEESDELLAVEDAVVDQARADSVPKRGRLHRFFSAWWHNPWARWLTIGGLLVAIAAVVALPGSRYFTLNALGVRSSASLIVLDDTTQLPLKNVTVQLGRRKQQTNVNGSVKFAGLKLGKQALSIQRVAFAVHQEDVTVGWGSNPLGTFALKAVGRQYTIQLTDYLSGKPVLAAEATTGDVSALSDKDGKATLTMDSTNLHDVDVTITATGYRNETLTLHADSTAAPALSLVPSRKAVFVTKQSGKYDLYVMDIDGKNRKLLLAGTGRENNNLSLSVSDDGAEAALVSTRDDLHDKDGFALSALTLVNINDGAVLSLDHADQVQLVDWIGNRIVWQAAAPGASASNPQRYRIFSYDYKTNSRSQLAAANQFNAVISSGDAIYFANSSTQPNTQIGFFKIKSDGTGRQRTLDQEVWSGFHVSPGSFTLQTPGGWYSYALKTDTASKINAPSSYTNHFYASNADGGKSAWVESRDGKGTLLVNDNGTSKETVVHAQEGLNYPVRWLNDHTFVYRVATAQETADYAVSLDGGSAKKITDVTGTYGLTQAY